LVLYILFCCKSPFKINLVNRKNKIFIQTHTKNMLLYSKKIS
jgi:hypothetical protein